MSSYEEFRASILKISEPRKTKSTKTFYSKFIIRAVKRGHSELKSMSEDTYSKIIRRINELLIEELLEGNVIKFPYNMGTLAIYSNSSDMYMKDGIFIKTAPVKWKETLKLWYTDSRAREKKVLLKDSYKKIYKVTYKTRLISYKNRYKYTWNTSRHLKLIIKNRLNNNIDIPSYERELYFN